MRRSKKANAVYRLRKILSQISDLERIPQNSPAFKKWHRDARVAIENIFGKDSSHIADFTSIKYHLGIFSSATPNSQFKEAYLEGLYSARSVLESMIEEILEYWEEDILLPQISSSKGNWPANSRNKVFIIHGHDQHYRIAVARLLEKAGLEPIILHEKPNKGRTIIEKVEDYGDVRFAVVLLTPDDLGSANNQADNPQPRARQNVIFEFGYFIGRLGRERVCALVKGNIEKPSDSDGILYVPMDDGNGWKAELLKELKNADFEIDTDQALLGQS